jgi:putative ABC transport system permease protein
MDAVLQDLRYAVRGLRQSPTFAAVSIVTLALGIGANTAMFQLLDAVEWRSLPVTDPRQLVEIRVDDMTHARGTWLRESSLTNPIWERLRAERDAFSGLAAWADEPFDISAGGETRKATVLWVSGEFFRMLGVHPLRGRLLEDADDRRGCGPSAVVLSYGFWQKQFGGDPAVVGRAVAIGKLHPDVIGVTPPSFTGLEVGRTFDVAVPICAEPAWHSVNARLESGMVWWLTVIGRLKTGVTLDQAAAVVRATSGDVFESTLPPNYPAASVAPYRAMRLVTLPAAHGLSRLRAQYGRSLQLLLAITTVVLVIACVNLAHLTRTRATGRYYEIAVRLSLGASGLRVAQLLVAESVVLTLGGVVAGAMLTRALCNVLISMLAADSSVVFLGLSMDWRMFAFMSLMALIALVISSLPIRRVVRRPPASTLALGRQSVTAAADARWVRRLLLASQMALSLVLVVGALLLLRTLRNLETLAPGFQPRDVIVADINFADLQLSSASAITLRHDLLERIRANPMVASASEGLILPVTSGNWNSRMWIDGADRNAAQPVMRNMIGTDYFRTLSTTVIAGSEFTDRDVAPGAPKVAIVNERFAHHFDLGAGAVGRRFRIETNPLEPEASYEIVGIVANTKYHDLREDDRPIVYVPLSPAALRRASGQFLIRASTDSNRLAGSLQTTFRGLNVHYGIRLFDDVVRGTLVRERLMAALAVPFGMVAMLLVAVGLYGVFSNRVAQRTHEIGIRIAVGATRPGIIVSILRETVVVLLIGLLCGAVLTFASSRALSALLFGVTPFDVSSLATAGGSLASIALLATYLPARRAAHVDPVVALRAE